MEEMLNYLDQKILDLKCRIDSLLEDRKYFTTKDEVSLFNELLKRTKEEREILCKIVRFISVRNDKHRHENMFND